MTAVAAALRDEQYEAVAGTHCSLCAMHSVCPLQAEGRLEPW